VKWRSRVTVTADEEEVLFEDEAGRYGRVAALDTTVPARSHVDNCDTRVSGRHLQLSHRHRSQETAWITCEQLRSITGNCEEADGK
jgi:hypothetical protein